MYCAMFFVRDRDAYLSPDIFIYAGYWVKWHMEDMDLKIIDWQWERDIRWRAWMLRAWGENVE